MCIPAFLEHNVLPRHSKVPKHHGSVSQDPYKHNGIPINSGTFLRKVLLRHQETTGLIRVREVEFLMSQNVVFPIRFNVSSMCYK